MMTLDALMQHLKYQDATHLITQDDGHMIAYRKALAFPKHWAFLHISKDGDSYNPGSVWLLTEQELPSTAKVIEYGKD